MRSTVLIVMIASAFAYNQVFAEDVYIAELMVESNVTLDAQIILTILNGNNLVVVDGSGVSQNVTLTNNTLVAECLIIGDQTSCNCSDGYVWSNEVCYNYNCCREETCTQNVSMAIPLCVAKVPIRINGSIYSSSTWSDHNSQMVKDSFEMLNGLQSVNVTTRDIFPLPVATFETAVSVKLNTSKLQAILSDLEGKLAAQFVVDTEGMVDIEVPDYPVCYKSTPQLICKFNEATSSSGWNMSSPGKRFELNNGLVVELIHSCATADYISCVSVILHELTGIWEGMYECGFISGSIRHTAKAYLKVALLPDVITMEINPLIADCSSADQKEVTVKVNASIQKTNEDYKFVWESKSCRTQNNKTEINNKTNVISYLTEAVVPCNEPNVKSVSITFTNKRGQTKSASVVIPTLQHNMIFCNSEMADLQLWPKTPKGETVTVRNCPVGRVGYKSRTCIGPAWKDVFSNCVSEELNNVKNAAKDFLNGLGATQEVAMDIFQGLKNSSTLISDTGDSTADISASINILGTMASATKNITLNEDVFPDLVKAASNMLNSNWTGVNDTVRTNMSASYIESVEDLVKNIKINVSKGQLSPNLDLKFCTTDDCNVTVFNISVNMNRTSGIMKTMAVKNLMNKLPNNFKGAERSPLLLSVTLQNSSSNKVVIKMDFPISPLQMDKDPMCVFWDPELLEWSQDGCSLNKTEDNRTVCVCTHLTSFSVLMSKTDVSNPILDMITYVGLGVSICSLLIFLLIEALVWSAVAKSNLSHFRHTSVVNIAMFRLLADCSFLASIFPDKLSESMCLAFTVCKHLFYLAMFCWMLCLSIMLVHQLIFVFSPLRKRVFMFLSSIVGYVCPIVIVGASYVYCRYTGRDYFKKETCWLVYTAILDGSLHAFLLPAGAIILTNLFSMVVVIVTLTKSSVSDSSKADDKETAKSILKVVVFLTPVFGITWAIGYFVFSLEPENEMHNFVSYTFTILNSFQGLFIFLTGCLAEQKVREELFKLITGNSKGNSDSTKNLTSYTKDR